VSIATFSPLTNWLFVLGDNPWPAAFGATLAAMFVLTCTAIWIGLLSVAYVAGRKEEACAALNGRHVAMSVGATALLVLLVLSHQWSVGNIGSTSNDVSCADFCRDKLFLGSGMPPKNSGIETCSCDDAQGHEAVEVPMAEVASQRGK
jgi:hypothetical protein